MSAALDELLQRASALPREERARLALLLAEGLASDAPANGPAALPTAEVWSPYNAHDATSAQLGVHHVTPNG
jgi:hypothetical protein